MVAMAASNMSPHSCAEHAYITEHELGDDGVGLVQRVVFTCACGDSIQFRLRGPMIVPQIQKMMDDSLPLSELRFLFAKPVKNVRRELTP